MNVLTRLVLVAVTLVTAAFTGCSSNPPPDPVPCAGGTQCGDVCTNLKTDNANCGACHVACAAGQVCIAGACAVSCQSGQTECGGACTNLATDRANCGACGTACEAGEVCSNGACALSCAAELTDCSGACVNVAADRENCGACGTACEAGEVCSNGSCALSCQQGLSDCSGTCVNTLTDRANCGACGTACESGEVCSNGTCQLSCQSGLTDCNGVCVDTLSDNAHCGACSGSCAPGYLCSMGACALGCQMGLTECAGLCTNTLSDNAHCGACGNACPSGQACVAGQCELTCQTGLVDCNGVCTNTASDNAHCGGCGVACAEWQFCAAGVCKTACDVGNTYCGANCVDPQTDEANCGGCGLACAVGATCTAGSCVCPSGGMVCNGACTATASDPQNCGGCGVVCGGTASICQTGMCVALGGAGTSSSPHFSAPPAASCKAYKTQFSSAPSGVYQVDPDGGGSIAPFNVYCDMVKDGGGWTLALVRSVDLSAPTLYGTSKTWRCLTPSYALSTSPTVQSNDVLHHQAFSAMGATEMMLMGGTRVLKFLYPRPGVAFVDNYRALTERDCWNSSHFSGDAPHSGINRSADGHVNQACVTTDFAGFKTKTSCYDDATNSHQDSAHCSGTSCGSWGNDPGNGQSPPPSIPNCWYYGGDNAAKVPQVSLCPPASQAPWATYAVGTLSGEYNLWVR